MLNSVQKETIDDRSEAWVEYGRSL
jgi:hypothetical protein